MDEDAATARFDQWLKPALSLSDVGLKQSPAQRGSWALKVVDAGEFDAPVA